MSPHVAIAKGFSIGSRISMPFVKKMSKPAEISLDSGFGQLKALPVPLSSTISTNSGTEMAGGPSMYPAHRTKIIHLVRHAQGHHNVAGELDYKAYESYEYLDASLTPLGWSQVAELRKHIKNTGIDKRIELIVTSPLTRTMQTAVGVFGGEKILNDETSPALMIDVAKSQHTAVSSVGCPPFVAVEWCREHMGVHPCDKRQQISKYKTQFPGISFSEIETDEDTWWKTDVREDGEEINARARTFIQWLLNRQEKQIAVVSHSSFLIHLCSLFGHDCTPMIQLELRNGFKNCELRTVILVDKSSNTVVPSSANFPGGVPPGPSAGSDLADEEVHGSVS